MPKIANRFSEHSSLDQQVIVRGALTVIDREGLAALTMRRLGRELGVEAMSIYHHIPNKAALMELIIDGVLAPAEQNFASSSPIELVEHFCRTLRLTLLAHRELAPVAARRVAEPTYRSEPLDAVGAQLISAGFDDQASAWIVSAFVSYVAGNALVELVDPERAPDDAAFETGLRFLLGGLRDELGL